MKRLFFALLALLLVVAGTQVWAASGAIVTERRQVAKFERVKLMGSPKIKYMQGNQVKVEVRGHKSIVKRIITRVEGNQLVVSVKSGTFNFTNKLDKVEVYVTSPDLVEVELWGSGDFESKGHVDTDYLKVTLKGSGDIDFKDIICDKLSATVVGSGDLDIEKLESLSSEVELVGSGDIEISQQRVKKTNVELKGSGDIKMSLRDCGTIDCRVTGSGDITLRGDVRKVNQYSRGSGDVNTAGLTIRK